MLCTAVDIRNRAVESRARAKEGWKAYSAVLEYSSLSAIMMKALLVYDGDTTERYAVPRQIVESVDEGKVTGSGHA